LLARKLIVYHQNAVVFHRFRLFPNQS
jgi:hypothetical protein